VLEAPELLNARTFKRAKTFERVFRLFAAMVVRLQYVFIVIDRIDCCRQDPQRHIGAKLLESLPNLVASNGKKVRVIITCAKDVPKDLLPPLAISYFTVDNRRKARQVAPKIGTAPAAPPSSSGSRSIVEV